MSLADNPKYREVFFSKVHGVRFYMPQNISNGYHMSRYVAAGAQDIFSGAGATKEVIVKIAKEVLKICNEESKTKTALTDIGVLMNNLLYRTKYPVDEDCAIRMGALFCFLENENPDEVQDFFTRKKLLLAKGDWENDTPGDPDLYAFFLSMGIEFTPSYKELSDISTDLDYLKNRSITLQGLIPQRYQTE